MRYGSCKGLQMGKLVWFYSYNQPVVNLVLLVFKYFRHFMFKHQHFCWISRPTYRENNHQNVTTKDRALIKTISAWLSLKFVTSWLILILFVELQQSYTEGIEKKLYSLYSISTDFLMAGNPDSRFHSLIAYAPHRYYQYIGCCPKSNCCFDTMPWYMQQSHNPNLQTRTVFPWKPTNKL